MRCGWLWKPTTRCCARPSRRTTGQSSSYTGDGMCAVFASPRAAVDAAIAAQRALELPVRMGIATGEAELRGGDYFGTVLNRTARVMAAGHGGQILLDGATAGLISGVDLIDLGPTSTARYRQAGRDVPGSSRRAADRVSAAEDTGFDARKPAAADHHLRWARVGTRRAGDGAEGTPVGDVDRCRRSRARHDSRWKSPPESASGFPDGVFVIELARGRRSRRGARGGSSRSRDHPAAGDELLPTASPRHWRDESDCWCSTTANTFWTLQRTDRGDPRPLRHGEDPGDQPRGPAAAADEQLWPVPSLDIDSSAAELFIERAHAVVPGISLIGDHARGCGDLPPPRRDTVGHRVGRITTAVDDGRRGA